MIRESVSFSEAAHLLGVSRSTIYRLVRVGKLEAFRFRRCVRIHLGELRRYKRLRAGCAVTTTDVI